MRMNIFLDKSAHVRKLYVVALTVALDYITLSLFIDLYNIYIYKCIIYISVGNDRVNRRRDGLSITF